MKHEYKLTGMTCSNCEEKVKSSLLLVEHVTSVIVSKENNSATISMDKHVSLNELQSALEEKYTISPIEHNESAEELKSWIETYKPIFLVFGYISMVTLSIQFIRETFSWMDWMRHFMAAFFLTFSFFKLMNLKGFSDSYRMYDIVARKLPLWGSIYAFLELGLGIAYLLNFNPIITNGITCVVMTISIIGVLQSVLNKRQIQCACLGAVFKLPMSTITIIEDALMIAMSGFMLVSYI